MRLKPIIDRLSAAAPSLRLVAGAVQLAAIKATPTTPAAFVLPLSDTVGANQGVNAVDQLQTDHVGILIAVSDVSKARGEAAHDDVLEVVRDEIRVALLGWMHPDRDDVFIYAGGRFEYFDGGVLYWMDEYQTTMLLRAY